MLAYQKILFFLNRENGNAPLATLRYKVIIRLDRMIHRIIQRGKDLTIRLDCPVKPGNDRHPGVALFVRMRNFALFCPIA
jgi:hypothetical protein